MPAVVKPVHSLWHQVIGFVFLVFAVILGFKAVSLGQKGNLGGLVICSFGALLTAWYGIDGFLRARRISRS